MSQAANSMDYLYLQWMLLILCLLFR